MSNHAEELDLALEAAKSRQPVILDPEISELAEIALDLKTIADPAFREQLKAELFASMLVRFTPGTITREIPADLEPRSAILPTLAGIGYGSYPINQRSFAASLAAHFMLLALVVGSGVWAANHEQRLRPGVTARLILPSDALLPAGSNDLQGGGGGGKGARLPASHGQPPRFSSEQLTPPTVIVPTESRLPAEPTVIGPPNVTFPADRIGDPLSAALAPSDGPGVGGGIGNSHGTGVGRGNGPGVGDGLRGGIGGDLYRLGGGVTAPRAIYDPEPEYSEEARKAKFQGNVLLWVVIGPDGRPRDIRIQRSLGMGLDQQAINTVRTWRFSPAMKDGQPVAVQVNIEVNFRLF